MGHAAAGERDPVENARGPGVVTFGTLKPVPGTIKGGRLTNRTGKASETVTFSEPGDYMLHVTANDYSGNGGGRSVCCWTTAIVNARELCTGRRRRRGGR